MTEQQMQELVQGIAADLQSGKSKEEIANRLVSELGISNEEATGMINEIEQAMAQQGQGGGQGQGAGPRDGSGQGQAEGISAQEALESFKSLGLSNDQMVKAIQIVSQMSVQSVEQLLVYLSKEGGNEEPAPQENNYDNY